MIRFLEVLPGALSWGTLLGLFFLSWKLPVAVAVFVVLYDLYWLLKTIYFFFHLRVSFLKMRERVKIDWLKKLKLEFPGWGKIHHMAVFTSYHEPYDVLKKSIESLSKTNFPLKNIFLILAPEARGGEEDQITAARLKDEFGGRFGNCIITTHPYGIPGEIVGKASNEAWAVRRVYEDFIKKSNVPCEDVLVSVFDADTRPTRDYFGVLTHTFLSTPNPHRAGYQPILIFSNAYRVPLFARLLSFSCSFWHLIQQSRLKQLMTISCYSISLRTLVDVGFWHTNVIAEDARIFYQCLGYYSGDFRTVPLFYPVTTDAVSGSTLWEAAKNSYKQQRRWAWGVENVSFVIPSYIKNKSFPLRSKIFWIFNFLENFHSWAISALIIFLFGFMPNLLGGAAFRTSVLSSNLPGITSTILNVSALGIVTSAFLSILLLSPRETFGPVKWYRYLFYLLQWALIPFAFIIFGSVPAFESQTRLMMGGKYRLGYWVTPKVASEKRSTPRIQLKANRSG